MKDIQKLKDKFIKHNHYGRLEIHALIDEWNIS